MSTSDKPLLQDKAIAAQALLRVSRDIWGDTETKPEGVLARSQVMLGDMARLVRTAQEEGLTLDAFDWRYNKDSLGDFGVEMANFILSMSRWLDDMGLDIERMLDRAEVQQRAYVEKLKES